jgi:hypothetical protein
MASLSSFSHVINYLGNTFIVPVKHRLCVYQKKKYLMTYT